MKIPIWIDKYQKYLFFRCELFTYNPTLTSSVIIIFYNEVFSAILRTLWSVILKTPKHLLHEIILVDDASTECESKLP